MRSILALTILTMSTFALLGQDADSLPKETILYSESYMPSDCFDSTFYVEKLEEINAQELGEILNKKYQSKTLKRNNAIRGVEFFNTVSVHKINQSTERIISNEKNLTLIPIYKSDIVLSPQYTIRVEYDFEKYSKPDYNTSYSIFDNVNNRYYKSFSSLEMMIVAMNAGKIYMKNGSRRNQEDLDTYLEKKVSSMEKMALRKKYRGTGGGSNVGYVIGGLIGAYLLVWIFSPD
ncbi:MAG: hypothetical protein HRT58_13730 [Crocinitomicaceae bacterium]|nr:hypothetical protein [Flavobacteriales bacterium]NQZ36725.1 hypothetical protein [Crocinitomicaceae bacterium]